MCPHNVKTWSLPQMLSEKMLQEMKMNFGARWAETEGFWRRQPIRTTYLLEKDIE